MLVPIVCSMTRTIVIASVAHSHDRCAVSGQTIRLRVSGLGFLMRCAPISAPNLPRGSFTALPSVLSKRARNLKAVCRSSHIRYSSYCDHSAPHARTPRSRTQMSIIYLGKSSIGRILDNMVVLRSSVMLLSSCGLSTLVNGAALRAVVAIIRTDEVTF